MFIRAAVTFAVLGVVYSLSTPFPFLDNFPGELEWDCTDDHRPHATDPRKFLQSANGFGEKSNIIESECPTKFMMFSQERGLCRCIYVPELREKLEDPCQAKPSAGDEPHIYEVLIPSLNKSSISELYEKRTCNDLLPKNVVDFFLANKVAPLFFNESACRCDWTEESKEVTGRPVAQGRKCETLVDQTFTDAVVSSDHVGNWIEVFPFEQQENVTLKEGGSLFGEGLITTIQRRLAGTDFRELNIIARFKAEAGNTNQIIFTNMCNEKPIDGTSEGNLTGTVELLYNPNIRQFSLQFFGSKVATCTPPNTQGGFVEQTAEVIYNHAVVRLVVNDFECDIGALNPVTESGNSRLTFSSSCAMQVGGAVKTDVEKTDFGTPVDRAEGFKGVFKNFVVLRNCPTMPAEIKERIAEA